RPWSASGTQSKPGPTRTASASETDRPTLRLRWRSAHRTDNGRRLSPGRRLSEVERQRNEVEARPNKNSERSETAPSRRFDSADAPLTEQTTADGCAPADGCAQADG